MNLAQAFVDSAAKHADRIALRTASGATTTYAELDNLTARAAGLLAEAGVGVGDRVGLMLRTSRSSLSSTTASCEPAPSSCR